MTLEDVAAKRENVLVSLVQQNALNSLNFIPCSPSRVHKSENVRYSKTDDLISKSQYRTIYRGFDNDSGCEIAWCVYPVKMESEEKIKATVSILENMKKFRHQYILMIHQYYFQNGEMEVQSDQRSSEQHSLLSGQHCGKLILVSELITAGSIREYLRKILLPRLIVIKNWCYKLLQGLAFLHENNLVHGKLSSECIYINSNNGDIKIGDLAIRQIPLFSVKYHEISQSNILKKEPKTSKFDVYCFGLILIEMISSDLNIPCAFKHLCRLINYGKLPEILSMVEDPVL